MDATWTQDTCPTVAAVAELHPAVQNALKTSGLTHEVMECDPDLADTAAFCAAYGIPLENSGNTIVVASKRDPKTYSACLVTATQRLDVNKKVRKLMGVPKVSFAGPEETTALTGMELGGVTLLGLPPDWPIFVDDTIRSLDYVILGGGNRSSKLRMAPDALEAIPGLEFVTGLALEARD